MGQLRSRSLRLVMGVLVLVMAGALSACGGSDDDSDATSEATTAASTEPVRWAHLATATHLPIMVAEAEGYFEDEGVEVERTVITDVSNLPGAMGRQFDLGSATMPDVIKANEQGIDVALTWNLASESSESPVITVVAGPDVKVSSPEDMVGKTVGVGGFGGNIHPSTLFWLIENGVDPESVNFISVPFPQQADQLLAGKIDVAEGIEPFVTQMTDGGGEVVVNNMVYVSDPASSVSTMANRAWAEENIETIAKITKALDRAGEFIASNEADARKIFAEYANLPQEVADSVKLPGYDTTVSMEELQRWGEVLNTIGELDTDPADIDYEALVVSADSHSADQ